MKSGGDGMDGDWQRLIEEDLRELRAEVKKTSAFMNWMWGAGFVSGSALPFLFRPALNLLGFHV